MGKLVGSGGDAQTNGALIITSRRVVFYRKGLLGEVLETMPIDKLTSVEQLTLMMKRTLRIHTSGDNLEFKSLNKEEYQAVVEALEEGRKAAGSGGAVESPQDSPVDASPQDSPVDILTKLAALRDSGVLSQEEFDEKKKSILEDI